MRHPFYFINIVRFNFWVILMFMLNGCGLLVRPKVAFIVENQSDYEISVSFYEDAVSLKRIFLSAGSTFDTTFTEDLGQITLSPFPIETDSVSVRFGNSRVITVYCNDKPLYYNAKCQFPKNLMDFNTGKKGDINRRNTSVKVITFDNSDYERAVEL